MSPAGGGFCELELWRDEMDLLLLERRLDDAFPADAVESPLHRLPELLLPWLRSGDENKFFKEASGRRAASPQWGQ